MLFFSFLMVLSTTNQGWKPLKPKEIKVEVLLPGQPIKASRTIETEMGEVKNYSYQYNDIEEVNFLYVVNVLEYQNPISTSNYERSEMMTDFLDLMIENYDATLVYQTDISKEDHKGILYRFSYDEDFYICKGKLFVVNGKLLSLMVFTSLNNSLNDDMDHFLNSLNILE